MIFDIKSQIHKIPHDTDLVVGIPRSGMIPAYMIALALNKKVCSIDEFLSGNIGSVGDSRLECKTSPIKNILVVDDSVNSGNAVNKARNKIKESKYSGLNFTYMAVYAEPFSTDKVDIALNILPNPRMFQWNYTNHNFLKKACLDIDGVLCQDPTEEENDDGPMYKKFLQNAKPLYIPNYKVMALVTSRLEKYRALTEKWLEDNNVQYEKLYMLNLPSKEERMKQNAHASFKSSIYKKLTQSNIFIESEPEQACDIANSTNKLVFCSKTDEMFGMPDKWTKKNYSNKPVKHKKLRKIIAKFIPIKAWRRKIRGK